jgi:hypothetical protein
MPRLYRGRRTGTKTRAAAQKLGSVFRRRDECDQQQGSHQGHERDDDQRKKRQPAWLISAHAVILAAADRHDEFDRRLAALQREERGF